MFGLFESKSSAINFPDIQVFNTESRQKEVFSPLSKNTVKLYTCGPTVYDYAHIGNLRAYVFADILKRTLMYNGYEVNHTINFTDFGHLTSDADTGEDKIMKGLRREGMEVSLESMRFLSDKYIDAFKEDIEELNIFPPTQFARASEFVKEQIALIETLEEKGYAYTTDDGVYFDVSKFPSYGRLGNIDIDALQGGARVEVNEQKRHPADFALWKNGELGWDSKWGKGFPGWHIECSAMAMATLGKQIDIHTGGVDNIATHHNGEIAQSESATGKQFSKYWMHSEHVNLNQEKMSKSSGQFTTLPSLLEQGFTGEEYRYWLLTSHYRSQVNFTADALEGCAQALQRLKTLVYQTWEAGVGKVSKGYQEAFIKAMNDDLDTPKAISLMWELVKDEDISEKDKRATIQEFDAVLEVGLSEEPEEGLKKMGRLSEADIPDEIISLRDEREAARIAHNWEEADRLREMLKMKGYIVEDTAQGPKLSKE